MSEERGFLIGPQLREKLKTTISRVEAMPLGAPVTRIPTALESGVSFNPKPRCLVMPMLVSSSYSGSSPPTFPPGSVVTYDTRAVATTAKRTSGELGTPLTSPYPYDDYFEMPSAKALLHLPSTVSPLVAPVTIRPWGVTAEGGTQNQSIVNVIVSGVAPVRIRSMTYMGGPAHYYAMPAIRRSGQETIPQLTGILETTDCACDNAAQIIWMEGGTSATTGGSETAQVFWGLVVI